MALKYYNELRGISLVKSETRLAKSSARQREGEYLIRLLSLGWCFEWLQVAIIGQDSGLSVRQVEMNEALSRWRLKFITVTFQFFWLGWFRSRTGPTILAADPTRSVQVSNQSLYLDFSLCLSISIFSRNDCRNWLIVVFLLSDWYKCCLAAIAELQVSTQKETIVSITIAPTNWGENTSVKKSFQAFQLRAMKPYWKQR